MTRMERLRAAAHITKRQLEMLLRLADDMSYRDIAEDMGVNLQTVKNHMQEVRSSMGLHRAAGLVAFCIRNGVIN